MLESYIDSSTYVLIYCSRGYFKSKNCMRELIAATKNRKPIVALLDPDASRGGLTKQEVRERIQLAEDTCYDKWGFASPTTGQSLATPAAQALYDHIFAMEPIEWNRIGCFQDVTMRLIAEAILPATLHGKMYVQGELIHQRPDLGLPNGDASFHLYCSPHNPGAAELVTELADAHNLKLGMGDAGLVELGLNEMSVGPLSRGKRATSHTARRKHKASGNTCSPLLASTEKSDVPRCQQFLVYLTGETWTGGERSANLAIEVKEAMDAGTPLLLAHEMPGLGGQEGRHGVEFATFFACDDGATPTDLLQKGIYGKIAIALRGSAWRQASMMLLLQGVQGFNNEKLDALVDESSLSLLHISTGKSGRSSGSIFARRQASRGALTMVAVRTGKKTATGTNVAQTSTGTARGKAEAQGESSPTARLSRQVAVESAVPGAAGAAV